MYYNISNNRINIDIYNLYNINTNYNYIKKLE